MTIHQETITDGRNIRDVIKKVTQGITENLRGEN